MDESVRKEPGRLTREPRPPPAGGASPLTAPRGPRRRRPPGTRGRRDFAVNKPRSHATDGHVPAPSRPRALSAAPAARGTPCEVAGTPRHCHGPRKPGQGPARGSPSRRGGRVSRDIPKGSRAGRGRQGDPAMGVTCRLETEQRATWVL